MQDNNLQVDQLRFLLESSSGPKFLFAVCEEPAKIQTYLGEVYAALRDHLGGVLDVSGVGSDILGALVSMSHSGVRSINLVDLSRPFGTRPNKSLFPSEFQSRCN